MNRLISLIVLFVCVLFLMSHYPPVRGQDKKEAPPTAAEQQPAHADVTAVGVRRAAATATLTVGVAGKSQKIGVLALILELSDNTHLLTVVDVEKLPPGGPVKLIFSKQRLFAIRGRLVPESKELGIGSLRLGQKEPLTLKDKKRLILVGDSITPIDAENKDRYPPQGKLWVEGNPICGKADLKLFSEPTLAVQNTSVPIVLEGEKAHRRAGKRAIRVVGALKVDARGLVRVQADEVKEVGK
jgi:hypothetical protein